MAVPVAEIMDITLYMYVTFMVCDGFVNAQNQELLVWQGPAVI
jgi:hypothetical protein